MKTTNSFSKLLAKQGHVKPRTPMIFPNLPEGEVIRRIEEWHEDNRREYWWQFWKPKHGTPHLLALTENGVYDITKEVKEQTR